MKNDFKKLRLQKIAMKLQELESSLSPAHSYSQSRSVSPLNRRPDKITSFTIDNENEFISNSGYSPKMRSS